MLQLLLNLLKENQGVVLSALGTFLAISIAKLPDPRQFAGKWWSYFYDVFFAFASRYSLTRWDESGGHLKLPGFQVPALKTVPLPPKTDETTLSTVSVCVYEWV